MSPFAASGAFIQAFELTMTTDDDTAAICSTDGTVPTGVGMMVHRDREAGGDHGTERPRTLPGAVARAHFVAKAG